MPINFTITYDDLTNDVDDTTGDIDTAPGIGEVRFVPQFRKGARALATDYEPRPAGFKFRTFKGYLDTDGQLKNKRGGTPGVRLWANDPVFNLIRLPYRVEADLTDALGRPLPFEPFIFEAPDEDVERNLTEFMPVPNATGVGITRGLPGASIDNIVYNAGSGNIEFYVLGQMVGTLALSILLAALSGGAPADMDTLAEVAAAIGLKLPAPKTHLVNTGWYEGPEKMAIPRNPNFALIGDSFVANSYRRTDWDGNSLSRTASFMGDGFWNQGMVWNNQPGTWWSFGVGGSTTTDAAAIFDSQVVLYEPQVVVIHSGNNDIHNSGRTAAQTFAGLLALVQRAWAIGANVILCNVITRDSATNAQKKAVFALNQMIANFCAANAARVALLDIWSVIGNPVTAQPKAGLTYDGTHPNSAGCWLIAKELEGVIDRFVYNKFTPLAMSGAMDDTNLLGAAGLMTGTGGTKISNMGLTGNLADGWFAASTGTDANMLTTLSKVPDADGYGDWQQMAITTVPSSSAYATLFATAVSGFAAGDVVRGAVGFETDAAGWANGVFDMNVTAYNSGSNIVYHKVSANLQSPSESLIATRPESGILITPPMVIPTGVDILQFSVLKGNLGTVRWQRPALRNLNKVAF